MLLHTGVPLTKRLPFPKGELSAEPTEGLPLNQRGARKQPARAIFFVPSAPYRGATVRNLPAPVFSLPGRVPWMYKMGIPLFMRVRRIATDFIISRPSAAIV